MNGRVQIQSHARSMIDSDGAVLLDIRKGKYYSFNKLGAHIWQEAEAGVSLPDILLSLEDRFDVPRQRLVTDLEGFLGSLEKNGLIRVHR